MKNKKNLDLNKLEPKLDESLNKSLTAREHNTPLIEQLLNETTPQEMTEIDKQMSEKTAVEQFAAEVLKYKNQTNLNGTDYVMIPINKVEYLKEKFKEVEKEQIFDAATWGFAALSAEDYYKQKYEQ